MIVAASLLVLGEESGAGPSPVGPRAEDCVTDGGGSEGRASEGRESSEESDGRIEDGVFKRVPDAVEDANGASGSHFPVQPAQSVRISLLYRPDEGLGNDPVGNYTATLIVIPSLFASLEMCSAEVLNAQGALSD